LLRNISFKSILTDAKPAITDVFKTPDGKEEKVRVFESASILLYLVEQYDQDHKLSYPRGTKEYIEMVNWLM